MASDAQFDQFTIGRRTTSRRASRLDSDRLAQDVAEFLGRGGKIECVDGVPATGGTRYGRRVCALPDCRTTFVPCSRTPWQRFCSDRCKIGYDQAKKRKPPVPKECACGRWFLRHEARQTRREHCRNNVG